jgi:hypothetical protein
MKAALAAVFSSARRIARDIDYATTIDRRMFEVVLMLTPVRRVNRTWILGLPELMSEVRLYRRPVTVDDALHAGVAQRTVARHLVLMQNTIKFRTQSLNAGTTLPVEEVSTKLDSHTSQLFKCVCQ